MEWKRARREPVVESIAPDPRSSFRSFRSTAGQFSFRFHRHPEVELTLIEKGRGLRYVGETVQAFEAGDLCLLGPNLPHTWSTDPRHGTVSAVVVQWQPERLDPLFRLEEWAPVRRLLERSRRGLFFSGPGAKQIARDMGELLKIPPDHPRRTLALLERLIDLAAPGFGADLCLKAPAPDGNPAIARVLAHIHNHADEGLDQAGVAARLGMAPSAFSRWFKRQVGLNWVPYLQDVRLARACRALSETDDSILSIATAAGFQNLSHFHKVFKKSRGLTPAAYRRRF